MSMATEKDCMYMNTISFCQTIVTKLGLCGFTWRQAAITQFLLEIKLADITNKSPCALNCTEQYNKHEQYI